MSGIPFSNSFRLCPSLQHTVTPYSYCNSLPPFLCHDLSFTIVNMRIMLHRLWFDERTGRVWVTGRHPSLGHWQRWTSLSCEAPYIVKSGLSKHSLWCQDYISLFGTDREQPVEQHSVCFLCKSVCLTVLSPQEMFGLFVLLKRRNVALGQIVKINSMWHRTRLEGQNALCL